MTPGSDPYRTLGLNPGATPAEVKRAYRRLAKAYHPDNAGERALPRFLAVQAAYERLTADQPGGAWPATRRQTARRPASEGPGAAPPGRAWGADPERARATRESGGPSKRTRPAGAPAGAGRGPTRRTRPKATIGSTSYDGTENEPFEPGWAGATWYGADSGTYWTINPKEYADPRKHGPEYLARARRNRPLADGAGEPEDVFDPGPPAPAGESSSSPRQPDSAGRPGSAERVEPVAGDVRAPSSPVRAARLEPAPGQPGDAAARRDSPGSVAARALQAVIALARRSRTMRP